MPSPIAHSVTGYVIFRLLRPEDVYPARDGQGFNLMVFYLFAANFPDLDFLLEPLTGVDYHHRYTHSLAAAFIFAAVTSSISRLSTGVSYRRAFPATLTAYASHLLLDFLSEGGAGIELLWPFNDVFFQSPVPVFPAVEHSLGLVHSSHLRFIGLELAYAAAILFAMSTARKHI